MKLVLLTLLILGGCTFTYTPLLREARAPEPRLVVGKSSALVQSDASLRLELQVSVPEADWLAVQWFSPANDEVSATSLWLEPTSKPQALSVALPSQIDLEDGLWRVVLSYQNRLVRQFSASVRAP